MNGKRPLPRMIVTGLSPTQLGRIVPSAPTACCARTILVVCRANQARSPLAAHLLLREAERRRATPHAYTISSAGVAVPAPQGALPAMCGAAARLGVDLDSHQARQLTAGQVSSSQLVLAMTENQRATISRMQPQALLKTFTLKEFVRIGAAVGTTGLPLPELVLAMHRARLHVPGVADAEDVVDPAEFGPHAMHGVAQEINDLVAATASVLFQR